MNHDPSTGPGASRTAGGFAAAWYPDPTHRFEFRYHNGQAWTGDVSVDGNRFLDPLPSAAPQAPAPMPFAVGPAAPVGVGMPFQPRESIAAAMAALILGICSILLGWVPFLCVLSAIGAIVGLALGIGVLRRDAAGRRDGRQPSRGHGYAVAGVVLAPIGLAVTVFGVWLTAVTLREVNQFTNVGAHHTEVLTCSVSDGLATASGTITNDSRSMHSYHLTVEFDRAGTSTQLASGAASIDDVAPDETGQWTVSERVNTSSGLVDGVDCTVRDVTGPVPFED